MCSVSFSAKWYAVGLRGDDFTQQEQSDPMVASVWRLIIPEKDVAMLMRECEVNILPQYKGAPGLFFVWLWHRPCVGYAEVQIVSLWSSLEQMLDFVEAHPWNAFNGKAGSVIAPEENSVCYEVVAWLASTE